MSLLVVLIIRDGCGKAGAHHVASIQARQTSRARRNASAACICHQTSLRRALKPTKARLLEHPVPLDLLLRSATGKLDADPRPAASQLGQVGVHPTIAPLLFSMNMNDAQRDSGATGRDDAVAEALGTVLDRLSQNIHQREVQQKACDRVAAECVSLAYDVLNMMYPARQTAATSPATMVNGSWEADPEPVPPSVERWIAGYLQVAVRRRLRCERLSAGGCGTASIASTSVRPAEHHNLVCTDCMLLTHPRVLQPADVSEEQPAAAARARSRTSSKVSAQAQPHAPASSGCEECPMPEKSDTEVGASDHAGDVTGAQPAHGGAAGSSADGGDTTETGLADEPGSEAADEKGAVSDADMRMDERLREEITLRKLKARLDNLVAACTPVIVKLSAQLSKPLLLVMAQ